MKSFTAKEFSRCPAKVYEAAREDGKAFVSHERYPAGFVILYDKTVKPEENKKAPD